MNITHIAFIVYMFPWFVSLIIWLLFDNTFTMLRFHRLNDFAHELFFQVTHYTFYIPCKFLGIDTLKGSHFFGGHNSDYWKRIDKRRLEADIFHQKMMSGKLTWSEDLEKFVNK